jgi:hypothetical protein
MRMSGDMNRMDLFKMAQWWTRQSLAGDKGGSFNTSLYLEYLKCRTQCTDYYTTTKTGLAKNIRSTVMPCANGK